MGEGGSYGFCKCAGEHINAGADVYQAAKLCNRGLSAPSGSSGGYTGNNVACMMMRDYPLMLAAMGCY